MSLDRDTGRRRALGKSYGRALSPALLQLRVAYAPGFVKIQPHGKAAVRSGTDGQPASRNRTVNDGGPDPRENRAPRNFHSLVSPHIEPQTIEEGTLK